MMTQSTIEQPRNGKATAFHADHPTVGSEGKPGTSVEGRCGPPRIPTMMVEGRSYVFAGGLWWEALSFQVASAHVDSLIHEKLDPRLRKIVDAEAEAARAKACRAHAEACASASRAAGGTYRPAGRVDHCWGCRGGLAEWRDPKCPRCGWMLCSCGSCGCNYRSTEQLLKSRPLRWTSVGSRVFPR